MWVWDETHWDRIVERAVGWGIQRLFVAVPVDLPSSPQLSRIAGLVRRAGAASVTVDALGGDPRWVDAPQHAVERWLRPVLRTGLFAAAHVDVEPHDHPGWHIDRPAVVGRYLELLDAISEAIVVEQTGAALEADLPFWFHTIAGGATTLDRAVLERVDAVTLLAYRNTAAGPNGTIAVARPTLAAAEALRRPARIGQETNFLGADPVCRQQTFHGTTRRAMERELDAVQTAYPHVGLAIHDSRGYAAMAP